MRTAEYLNIAWLCLSVVVLIAWQVEPWGFGMLAAGFVALLFTGTEFRRNIALVYASAVILGIMPIGTSTDYPEGPLMGIGLFLAVFVPYYVSRYIYKDHLVRFPFGWRR